MTAKTHESMSHGKGKSLVLFEKKVPYLLEPKNFIIGEKLYTDEKKDILVKKSIREKLRSRKRLREKIRNTSNDDKDKQGEYYQNSI